MTRVTLISVLAMLVLSGSSAWAWAQQGKTTSAATSTQEGCLIVKHKGTVGRRLIWTALTGIPIAPGAKYDLVDSVGYKPDKTSYKGKELKALQKQGVHVIVLKKHYKTQDLDGARKSCREGEESPASGEGNAPSSTGPAKNKD